MKIYAYTEWYRKKKKELEMISEGVRCLWITPKGKGAGKRITINLNILRKMEEL